MINTSQKVFLVLMALAALGQCVITVPLKKGKATKEIYSLLKRPQLLRGGVLSDKLINLEDDIYLGQIQVGKSQQVFEVVFDTGSPYFWVPSEKCESCKELGMKKSYDCIEEDGCSTSEYIMELGYGTGTAIGNITTFLVSLPGTEPIEYGGLLLLDAVSIPPNLNGIVGLSPTYTLSGESSYPTLISALYKAQLIEKPVISFFQAFYNDDVSGKDQSAMTIGGYDHSKVVGNVEYFNMVQTNAWSIQIEDFKVGGVSIFGQGKKKKVEIALVDTGTTSFYMRPDYGERFFDQFIKVRGIKLGDNYEIDCNAKLPNISLTLINKDNKLVNFELEPAFYVTKNSDTDCRLYFEGFIGGPTFVIGNTFLRKFLPIFDFKEKTIGFARTITQADQAYAPHKEAF